MKEKCPNCKSKLTTISSREGRVYMCLSCGYLYHGKEDLKNAKQKEKWKKYADKYRKKTKWRKYANL